MVTTPRVLPLPVLVSMERSEFAPVALIASATLSGVRPPESMNAISSLTPSSARQSKGAPLPPGRVLSAGADKLVRVWDTFTGQELFRLVGHTDAVAAVTVSPDGDRAASAGHDGTVRLWDLRLRKELRRFDGHAGTVLCVAFTPDGRNEA